MRARTGKFAGALILIAIAPLSMVNAVAADDTQSQLSFSIGFDYSTGEYGEEEPTEIWYIPFTTKYERGRVAYKLMIPYLDIVGPGDVSGDGVVVKADADPNDVATGVGDVDVSVFFNVLSGQRKSPWMDVGIKASLATGDDDKGLGKGEEDYALQLDLFDQFGRYQVFGTLGYKWRGDPDDDEERLDGVFANVGTGYSLGSKKAVGVMFDFEESSLRDREDSESLMLYYSHRLDHQRSVVVYLLGGLSDSSADAEIGMQITFKP
jgi:hypothetical protein